MTRWHRRLAELHAGSVEQPTAPASNVQTVQNVQILPSVPASEHFEQIEQATTRALMAPPAVASWGEIEEERAAIIEEGDHIPRAWAEGYAQLNAERPPGDVPLGRWQRFVDDVGAFLDSPFCAVAVALGWGPLDLFGCDRDRPFARIDQAGLLWLLNGERLVALSENTATIEMSDGVRQRYCRFFGGGARASVWELAECDKSR